MVEEVLKTGQRNALSPEYLAKEVEPWNSRGIAETGRKNAGRCCYSFYVHSSGRLLSARGMKEREVKAVYQNLGEQS